MLVVVLRNHGNPSTRVDYLARRVAAEVIGIELPERVRVEVEPDVLERHAGTYAFPEFGGAEARVTVDGGTLVLEGMGPRFVLVPGSGHHFFITDSFSTCDFEVDGEGRTTALKLNLSKRTVVGERIEGGAGG